MAKKKEKTLEEKLQEALVPENQWPYILPENWCWTKGKYILEKMESQKPEGDYFYYIDIDAIDNSCQIVTEPKQIAVCDAPSRASRKIHVGDTIFSLVRPYLKNIAYIDKSLSNSIASTGFYVCTPKKNVFPKFFYWLMISPYVVDGLNKYMKGDNSPSIRGGDIEGFCYPIPPLPEQKRIVYRIESLFAKLDEAKEKIQQVLDGAEMRKAAILHKAFTGELTKTWRRENGISEDSWELKKIGDIFNLFSGKGFKASEYTTNGIKLLRISNVSYGSFDWEDTKYLPYEYKEIEKKLLLRENDILIALNRPITNGKLKICLIDNNEEYILYQRVGCMRCKEDVLLNSKYVFYAFNDYEFLRIFSDKLQGSDQPYINLPELKSLLIPMCTIKEQSEIVSKLETILKLENYIANTGTSLLSRIDTMKKSILAKAFRGELGTNNPTEGNALNLLKEVLQDKS